MLLHGILVCLYLSPLHRTKLFSYAKMSKRLLFGRKMPKMPLVSSDIATWICSLAVCISLLTLSIRFRTKKIEGKYSHTAVWRLLDGYELPNNTRHFPFSAMVANLAKPTPEKPAMMRHDNVVSFFHEMGHVFHNLLSKTKYSRFHGTRFVLFSLFCLFQLRLLLVLRAISLKHLPRCWRIGMVLSLCLLITTIFSFSIPLLGVGNLRFFKKCRVITRQRSSFLKSSFRKS